MIEESECIAPLHGFVCAYSSPRLWGLPCPRSFHLLQYDLERQYPKQIECYGDPLSVSNQLHAFYENDWGNVTAIPGYCQRSLRWKSSAPPRKP